MEVLTLVQTGKSRKIPIILVHRPFWQGLIDWFQARLVAEKMINDDDMDLIQVLDEPSEIVAAIFNYYERRGFSLSPSELEVQLNL